MQITEYLQAAQLFRRSYEKAINAVAARNGMAGTELHVLLFLLNNPGCDTARSVSELRFLAKSCVSKAVEALTARGFLLAQADPLDRRVLHLHIQDAARDVLREGRETQEAFFAQLCRDVAPKERAALEKLLKKMTDNIREAY